MCDVGLYSSCEVAVVRKRGKGPRGRCLCGEESEIWFMLEAMASSSGQSSGGTMGTLL